MHPESAAGVGLARMAQLRKILLFTNVYGMNDVSTGSCDSYRYILDKIYRVLPNMLGKWGYIEIWGYSDANSFIYVSRYV